MSDLSDKISWAVKKFNEEIASGKDAKECLGLLYYVKKIYPKGKFPAWARSELSDDAYSKAKDAGFNLP